ncbi:Glu/Leu/Phe/Val dehydrogenase dimerization domain-containing protein [Actinomadura sp. WMMB 499]|uniref:Glu/Leu/Phe/Val dehydrogenase dimerization domain-containing protein n=1 Tax=Actinomadura sp. WMMB 499 TaxID=1219491 RepID=UPI00124615F5|nr:Glu/Leu/Phe/Val dehydrogenase dimerization domain-containing protein [Actinomadura sp. WMMB 499]QFG22446.1 glutamate dehydrogenase [Actinomadura sp. WMMB 499]
MNAPHLAVTWTDEVTGVTGHLVVDRLRRGVASGGVRMRAGCTLREVTDLARVMSLKETVVFRPGDRYRPFGGAKGGIDLDPRHPEARGVLKRYFLAMRPLLEHHWATGEDLGVRQATIDGLMAEIGMRSSVEAALPHVHDGADAGLRRLASAFAVTVDEIGLGDLTGGYGVARAVVSALRHDAGRAAGARAVIQGFGSMGGATARYLAREGLRIVGITDADGLVVNPDGLDVETMLRARTVHGGIDRDRLAPGDRELPGDAWIGVDADVLVTAAVSYAVHEGNHERVRARYVAEAANASVTPGAEAALAGRDVVVLPDFVVNSAANAWWWWTLFGDCAPTAESAFAKIGASMDDLVGRMLRAAAAGGTVPRDAAVAIAEANAGVLGAEPSTRRKAHSGGPDNALPSLPLSPGPALPNSN